MTVVLVVGREARLGIDIVRVLCAAFLAGGVGRRGLEVGETLHPAGKGPLARMSVGRPRGSLGGGHDGVFGGQTGGGLFDTGRRRRPDIKTVALSTQSRPWRSAGGLLDKRPAALGQLSHRSACICNRGRIHT